MTGHRRSEGPRAYKDALRHSHQHAERDSATEGQSTNDRTSAVPLQPSFSSQTRRFFCWMSSDGPRAQPDILHMLVMHLNCSSQCPFLDANYLHCCQPAHQMNRAESGGHTHTVISPHNIPPQSSPHTNNRVCVKTALALFLAFTLASCFADLP
jgi:hypothetical protein